MEIRPTYRVDGDLFFVPDDGGRRGHSKKLFKRRCRLDIKQWGSGIKTHSLGGACIGDTGSELQLYVVVYCTHIELD